MRIFTFSRILGIAAIGVAYTHGKRGGDATLNSISDTLRYLWSSASDRIARTTSRDRSVMPERRVNPKMGAPNGLSGDRPPPRPQGGGAI